MNLLDLTITNFRSFKGPEVFQFPDKPGLYHMQGDNQVDPRLTGNGSGKSTIWEAVLWLLDGKMSNGLKAGDVCNWDSDKGTSVEMSFCFDDDPLTVWYLKRTWKPNSWTLSHVSEQITDEAVVDLTKDPSNAVLGELRIKIPTFLQCIILAQEAPMFLDLKTDAQTSLFSEVLELEKWAEYSKKASDMATQQDRNCRLLEADLARAEGMAAQKVDYGLKVIDWNAARAGRAAGIEDEYDELVKSRKSFKKADPPGQAEYAGLHDLEREVAIKQKAMRAVELECHAIAKDIAVVRDRVDRLDSKVRNAGESGDCPECGQPIGEHFADQMRDEAQDLLEQTSKLMASKAAKDAELEKLLDEIDHDLGNIDSVADLIRDREDVAKLARRAIEDADRRLDRLEDELDSVLREQNPWVQAQKDELGRARSAQDEVLRVRTRLDKGNELYSLYALWIKGFKEVRLQQIAEALTELEIEVNSSLLALGLPGWELLFSVDRETKGGTIQRGFSVSVKSPHTDRAVPWASWSGGEKQRLRLAASMGLSNLIRTRMGIKLALEVWDEPTKGLSPEGVTDLLACLEQRAREEDRVIWIVEHTSHVFGGFSGGVTVVKDQKGSHLKVDQPYI